MYKVKNKIAPVNLRNLFEEEYTRIAQGQLPQVISKLNTQDFSIDKRNFPFQNLEPKRGMQYQHIGNSFEKYGNFEKRLHETLMQILKDQDEYLEPLTILQQLSFS